MEADELRTLEEQVAFYEQAVGRPLQCGVARSTKPFRVHGADAQLTFNKLGRRSQNQTTEEWFAAEGVVQVAEFRRWGTELVQQKFQERILHISLTLEESTHAGGDVKRVHSHARMTFEKRADRTSAADFAVDGVVPHVAA